MLKTNIVKIFIIIILILNFISFFGHESSGVLAKTVTDLDYFEFNEETGAITGYDIDGPNNIIIPPEFNGEKVTKIDSDAFGDKNLKSVKIPDTVIEIGEAAFADNNLEKVKIPNSVTEIAENSFDGEVELSNVTGPILSQDIMKIKLKIQNEEDKLNKTLINKTIDIIEERFKAAGLLNPVVEHKIDNEIIIKTPYVEDFNYIEKLILQKGKISFKNQEEDILFKDDGNKIKNAQEQYDDYGRPQIFIETTSKGAEKLEEVTRSYLGMEITAYLDNIRMHSPRVQSVISENFVLPTVSFANATINSIVISEGPLQVDLKITDNIKLNMEESDIINDYFEIDRKRNILF